MSTPHQKKTLSSALAERWTETQRKIAELAEAFPADKYESRQTAGIRSVGEVLRHVAFWNQYVADSLRGKENDGAANEFPRGDYPNKNTVIEALRRTSEDAAAALAEHGASPDSKAAELVMTFNEHTSEHYGQLVVYARLMGIVPPASRS